MVNSVHQTPDLIEIATLGGGCFWCLEPLFEQLQGVEAVLVGYAGGRLKSPTYEEVCTGTTGHAEVVQIRFNPRVVSFHDLVKVFFTIHDPTTRNRQGADVGPQYRSIILYHNQEQKETAERTIQEIEREGIWNHPIVTEITPFEAFYLAEEYHQGYYKKNPWAGYCRVVIAPKVAKFRSKFIDKLKKEPSSK